MSMNMDRDDVISTLNDLIETARDGEEGFRTSAENAKSPELKAFFQQGAQRCSSAVQELQMQVSSLGGSPAERGTVAGAMHRGWVNLKSALSMDDDKAILNEVERGEDHACEVYRDAMQKDLPPDLKMLVTRMYDGTRQNHDKVKMLRDQYARG